MRHALRWIGSALVDDDISRAAEETGSSLCRSFRGMLGAFDRLFRFYVGECESVAAIDCRFDELFSYIVLKQSDVLPIAVYVGEGDSELSGPGKVNLWASSVINLLLPACNFLNMMGS